MRCTLPCAVAIAAVLTLGALAPACPAGDLLEGFVRIEGATFQRGRGAGSSGSTVRVEEFEILDHPLTNLQYKAFVDATGHPAPLHWDEGRIPPGREDFPVIFVNRADVLAFLSWISGRDGRLYRLPTAAEFEYASRGGLAKQRYPWGNDGPAGKANFDADGTRPFDRWEEFLEPARSRAANGYGLYGMSGNLWQMVEENHDPATARYKYRIDNPAAIENGVMGGSWARSAEYLQCGFRLAISAGIRHPDLGFRPIRQPGSADWTIDRRGLTGCTLGEGRVHLSWALLEGDEAGTAFHVYRASSRDHAGFRVTSEPVARSTTFVDPGVTAGSRYHYYVRTVDASGKEGRRSEWAGVTAASGRENVVQAFEPLYQQGSLAPVFGDLDGDGMLDCVVRMDNGNQEMSQDPGLPVQLEAFTSYGRSLWRKDVCRHDRCFGSANNVPFNVWDMDGDGKAEVITRLQIGEAVWVAILDGMSGELKHKAPWPEMVSDFARSSTRIHMSIAYLDGANPAVVTQTGLYENEVFVAFDAELRQLWRFDSFAATNGSGGHKIEVADVDGDGRQEVFNGTTCLNHDGTLRWSIYKQHPDIVSVHDHLPDRVGLEVFYIVESSVHAGIYMVDANTGEILWKVNREDDPRWTHGHYGWTSDIWADSPGIECISNRAGHGDRNVVLFAADGRVLLEPFPYGYTPLEWDGDLTRELIGGPANKIGDFNGQAIVDEHQAQPDLPQGAQLVMVADLCGDFRDELVLAVPGEHGRKKIVVVTATHPIGTRYLAATESLDYRLWLSRNMGGGYRSVYDRSLRAK